MAGGKRRFALVLVLANYVLALTVGERFHVHRAARCGNHGAGSVCGAPHLSAGCDAGCEHEHAAGHLACGDHQDEEHGSGPSRSYHGEKCPVCQFLAQKPAPPQPVEAVTCMGPLPGQVTAKPVRRVERALRSPLIRGPPAVA